MKRKLYRVHVIVDAAFGDRLHDMPIGEPVWIVVSEVNNLAFNAVGKERQPKRHLEGLSSFKVDKAGSPEDWLVSEMQTIDLHHGEVSHDPPWSMINVIGVKWSKRIQDKLEHFGFNRHENTTEGFTAWR